MTAQQHTPSLVLPDSVTAHLRDRMTSSAASGQRFVLGLVGAPGGGKSTLAEAIVAAFPGESVLVPMDGYHLANSTLERLGRRQRKGAPDTFDAEGYVALLQRIRQGVATVYAPEYRREFEEGIAGAIAVPPDVPLVVTEGNYLLMDGPWQDVRGCLDETWFVDVDDELRRERLAGRHMRFGRTKEEALAWIAQTDEPNARLIALTRPLADAAFNWDMGCLMPLACVA